MTGCIHSNSITRYFRITYSTINYRVIAAIFGTGSSYFIFCYCFTICMSQCRYFSLSSQNFITYRTVFPFCPTCICTSRRCCCIYHFSMTFGRIYFLCGYYFITFRTFYTYCQACFCTSWCNCWNNCFRMTGCIHSNSITRYLSITYSTIYNSVIAAISCTSCIYIIFSYRFTVRMC